MLWMISFQIKVLTCVIYEKKLHLFSEPTLCRENAFKLVFGKTVK